MLNKLRKEQGFTLIELLIVVAIIGILAAIAIPQFSAYRMRGYNATALSDMKNTKTAEESLYADAQCYGVTDAGAATALDAVASLPAVGVTQNGPMAAAVGGANPLPGGRLAGVNAANATSSIPVGLSNGINLYTIVSKQASTPQYDSYVLATRHWQADTSYASDSDNTTVTYRVVNSAWAGDTAKKLFIAATVPKAVVGADDLGGVAGAGGVSGGGSPTDKWTIM